MTWGQILVMAVVGACFFVVLVPAWNVAHEVGHVIAAAMEGKRARILDWWGDDAVTEVNGESTGFIQMGGFVFQKQSEIIIH